MDLSTLAFKADTTELERARKVVKELVNDFSKFDKSMQSSARLQAQTEQLLARAAKEQASARKENAKAADIELRSAIAADKADQSREKSIKKSTKATEDNTKATQENVSILQRQKDIYDFLAAGYSKGQASILATAKATGQLSEELKKVLEAQKKFTADPFDRSDTGLKRMQKTLKEASEAQGFLSQGFNLTSKQAKELSNDLDRLSAGLKSQGKSYQEITKAQEVYKQQFVDEATALNKANAALSVVEKGRLDAANATKYFTLEDQKMAAALGTSNAAFDKAGSDKIVKYEQALIKSGLAQDIVTKKLATYKGQLAQIQAAEEKRAAANLTRAISPQLTDIAVSLYSGQAPLTVLLQQGGQLADIFRLSGVEAGNLGKLMKDSFYSMIPVIKEVGLALGGLATGMLMDLGRGTVKAIADFTGMSFAVEKLKQAVASGGEQNFKYIGSINKLGNALSVVAAVGIVAVITALIAMGLEYKKIIQQESELSVALATSGGAMAMSKDQAVAYAEGMKAIGVSTLKAMDGIGEFAKAGKVGKEGLDLIIKSALDLEKYAGVAVSETAKQYAKLQDEPTKALIEIAEKTGQVNAETLDLVRNLEQQGDKAKAAALATEALTSANTSMASEVKANLSPLEKLWDDIKSAIGRVKQEIYDLTTSNSVVDSLSVVWKGFALVVANVWYLIKSVATEIGGIAAQIGTMDIGVQDFANPVVLGAKIGAGFNNPQAQAIRKGMIADAKAARDAHDLLVATIVDGGEKQVKIFNENKKQNSEYAAWTKDNEKALERQYSKEERLGQKKKQLQADVKAGIIDETKAAEALAGWTRIIMGEKKPKQDKQPLKDLETEIDLTNKSLGLLGTFNNELAAIERRRAKTGDEDQYQKSLNDLIKKQPVYLEHQKEINAAHELYNKLTGKQEGKGSSYYKDLEAIQEMEKSGTRTTEQILEMKAALEATTPEAKKFAELMKTWTASKQRLSEINQKDREELEKMNSDLAGQEGLIGLSVERAKQYTIELQKQAELTKVDIELQKKLRDIKYKVDNDLIGRDDAADAEVEAEEIAADKRVAIQKKSISDIYTYYRQETDSFANDASNKLSQLFKDSGQNHFASAVTSLNQMVISFQKLVDMQAAYNKAKDSGLLTTKELGDLEKKNQQAQLNSYGNITGAMKGFFKEGSKGYKALQTAEKVFRAFEMAMALKSAAVQIAQTLGITSAKVAGDATVAASSTASAAVQVAAQGAVAQAAAVTAVATQGTGDPYTAFPRIAAMIAIMAGLGILVGGSKGGSGVQASNKGTGTVFGDSEAKSESIANSLEILKDVNSLTAQYSQQMAASLRNIEASLTGVTNIILRSNGMELSERGVVTGTKVSGLFGTGFMNSLDKKIISALFGTKTTITGQGVMANDATIQEIAAGQLSAGYYTDINKKKSFLGLTVSDKNSTNFDQSEALSRQFTGIINGFVDVVKAAAPILGVSLGDIDKSLEGFIVKIGKIDLKDLKGDEIKEKLMAVFGAAGDDIAMQTLKGFEKYQQVGEGYLETITRVATTTEQVRGQMDSLNMSMSLTVDGAMELSEAFGGLEEFLQSTSNYLQNYYTEEERKQTIARQASAALKTKGLDVSADTILQASRADVRALVESTKGDKDLYAWAVNFANQISPLFEDINSNSRQEKDTSASDAADAAKKAQDLAKQRLEMEKQLYTLQGDDEQVRTRVVALRELELLNMDASLHSIQRNIWALEDQKAAQDKVNASIKAAADIVARLDTNARAATDKAYAALERAVNAEKEKAQAAVDAAEEVKDNLTSIFDLLKDNVRELYQEVDSTAKMLAAQGRTIIQGAISTGVMPSEKDLSDAIGSVRADLEGTAYATKYESDRARLLFANELSLLKDKAGEQLTEAERQLKAAEDAVDYLDKVLKTAKDQIDALRGIDTSISDVATAIQGLTTALGIEYSTALKGQQKYLYGTGGASYDVAAGAGVTSGGQAFTKEGLLSAYNAHMQAGGSIEQVAAVLAASGFSINQIEDMYGSTRGSLGAILDELKIPRFAGGGMHSGGLAITSENGPELINFGGPAQIYTAQETKAIMQGGAGASNSNTYELQAIAIQSARTARTVDRLEKIIDRLVQPGNDGIDALNVRTVN